jgi:hypothetical protein
MHKKNSLIIGGLLAVTFGGLLTLLFMPFFGEGLNGLDFADNLFNKLSKGSSYFIPQLETTLQEFKGKTFEATIKLEKPELSMTLLQKGGVTTKGDAENLTLTGDIGALGGVILKDVDLMYQNDGKAISANYGGVNEKEVMKAWWAILKALDKNLKQSGKIPEAEVFSQISKRGIEPAYNFYGIESQKVSEKAGLMIGLLVFYVAYTMHWGFAIFYIFEGIGLTMKKTGPKKEV